MPILVFVIVILGMLLVTKILVASGHWPVGADRAPVIPIDSPARR